MSSIINSGDTRPLWRYVWYCHGLPDRSLRWSGRPLPICARCTGLWIGYGLAATMVWFWMLPWWLSLWLVAPLIADGGTQALGWRTSNNTLRLVTGLMAGIGEIMFIVWALVQAFLLGQAAGNNLLG